MKKRINFKVLLILAVLMIAMLFTGCTTAEVNIGRDGSGTATFTITKTAGVTKESVDEKIKELFKGVEDHSGDQDRLTLGAVEETDDAFKVVVHFKRIQYSSKKDYDGVGKFTYETAESFVSAADNVNNLRLYWGKGNFKPYRSYKNILYTPQDGTGTAIKAIDASTGSVIAMDDFVGNGKSGKNFRAGLMHDNPSSMFFTFYSVDMEGLDSVTFKFAGNIKVYGGANMQLVDSSTVKITPSTFTAQLQSTSGISTETVNYYAGFVLFDLGTDWVVMGIVIGIGALIVGFLIYGIFSGLLKRIIKGKTLRSIIRNYDLYLMMIPAIIFLFLFAYMPMGGVVLAFKNYRTYDGIWGSEWAGMFGFRHFYSLFTLPAADFGSLFANTFILALLKFITGFTFAIILAVLFSYLKKGIFKKTVQTISYFPYFISWVVVSGIAYIFLATNGGVINSILGAFGQTEPINFYAEAGYWRFILTFMGIWKTVGYSTIVYLAAITSIDTGLYEAITIDGGGRLRQLFHVTIPGMFPVIGIQIVFSLGNLVKDDVDQIVTMTRGSAALNETTKTIGVAMFKNIGSVSSYSASAAMGLMQGLIALILVITSNKVLKKFGIEGAY